LLNDKFIPYVKHWGWGRNPGYDAFRKGITEKIKPNGGLTVYILQGTPFVICTATGRPLGSKSVGGNPAAGLKKVLEDYAKRPEAERRPAQPIADANHPVPLPPEGGLVLTVWDRFLIRDAKGLYALPASNHGGWVMPLGNGRYVPTSWTEWRNNGEPFAVQVAPAAQRNSFWLQEAEWRALVPQSPKVGQTNPLPERLTKRISLYALWCSQAWQGGNPWEGDSIRQADLKLTVQEATSQTVRLRIHGTVLLVHEKYNPGHNVKDAAKRFKVPANFEMDNRYDVGVEGTIVYDPARKRITRWDMVALGDYSGYNSYGASPVTPRIPYGHCFELDQSDYEVPAELRRPKPYVLLYQFAAKPDFYWIPEKYQEDWRKHNKK
jgi:hypothetical protein